MSSDKQVIFDDGDLPWYALHVRTQSEAAVVEQLSLRGLTAFSPSTKVWKCYSDRRKQADQAFIPGYVFCQFDVLAERFRALSSPGVIRIVGIGSTPVPVPANEIFSLQHLATLGRDLQPYQYLHLGQRVRVELGAYAGVEGYLVQFKGKDRLVVSINLLQRSVSAEVDARLVVPVTPQPLRAQAPVPVAAPSVFQAR